MPWDLVRVWSVESAGNFDRDMEVRREKNYIYIPYSTAKLTLLHNLGYTDAVVV